MYNIYNKWIPTSNDMPCGLGITIVKNTSTIANKAVLPNIKAVKFNDPATIVFWEDGEKTVVKTQDGEPFDKEKGLAMAIVKKLCGNSGSYYNVFKKFCE